MLIDGNKSLFDDGLRQSEVPECSVDEPEYVKVNNNFTGYSP